MQTWMITQLTLAQASSGTATPDQTPWMVWAIIAFAVAITLLALEAFLPSGGVLGVLAIACAIAGIVMFFMFDDLWGMISMAVTLLATPPLIAGMLWIWPNTPIGRALTLDTEQKPVSTDATSGPQDNAIAVGIEGQALTELRPIGTCRLNDQRIDCIAQTGLIPKGTAVRVIAVEGTNIKVKAI